MRTVRCSFFKTQDITVPIFDLLQLSECSRGLLYHLLGSTTVMLRFSYRNYCSMVVERSDSWLTCMTKANRNAFIAIVAFSAAMRLK